MTTHSIRWRTALLHVAEELNVHALIPNQDSPSYINFFLKHIPLVNHCSTKPISLKDLDPRDLKILAKKMNKNINRCFQHIYRLNNTAIDDITKEDMETLKKIQKCVDEICADLPYVIPSTSQPMNVESEREINKRAHHLRGEKLNVLLRFCDHLWTDLSMRSIRIEKAPLSLDRSDTINAVKRMLEFIDSYLLTTHPLKLISFTAEDDHKKMQERQEGGLPDTVPSSIVYRDDYIELLHSSEADIRARNLCRELTAMVERSICYEMGQMFVVTMADEASSCLFHLAAKIERLQVLFQEMDHVQQRQKRLHLETREMVDYLDLLKNHIADRWNEIKERKEMRTFKNSLLSQRIAISQTPLAQAIRSMPDNDLFPPDFWAIKHLLDPEELLIPRYTGVIS